MKFIVVWSLKLLKCTGTKHFSTTLVVFHTLFPLLNPVRSYTWLQFAECCSLVKFSWYFLKFHVNSCLLKSSPSTYIRRVRFQHTFANCLQAPDFKPRLYVQTCWNPPRENPDLEDKLLAVHQKLGERIAVNKTRWKNNLSKQEREELQELKSYPNVLPTDKNLGPFLLSTDWVQAETLRFTWRAVIS